MAFSLIGVAANCRSAGAPCRGFCGVLAAGAPEGQGEPSACLRGCGGARQLTRPPAAISCQGHRRFQRRGDRVAPELLTGLCPLASQAQNRMPQHVRARGWVRQCPSGAGAAQPAPRPNNSWLPCPRLHPSLRSLFILSCSSPLSSLSLYLLSPTFLSRLPLFSRLLSKSSSPSPSPTVS